jgi:hypothetical protein
MPCRNGGKEIGLVTNGGFAEYIAVPEKNVFKIPDDMQWELAASIPVTTLTPYQALKQSALKMTRIKPRKKLQLKLRHAPMTFVMPSILADTPAACGAVDQASEAMKRHLRINNDNKLGMLKTT